MLTFRSGRWAWSLMMAVAWLCISRAQAASAGGDGALLGPNAAGNQPSTLGVGVLYLPPVQAASWVELAQLDGEWGLSPRYALFLNVNAGQDEVDELSTSLLGLGLGFRRYSGHRYWEGGLQAFDTTFSAGGASESYLTWGPNVDWGWRFRVGSRGLIVPSFGARVSFFGPVSPLRLSDGSQVDPTGMQHYRIWVYLRLRLAVAPWVK